MIFRKRRKKHYSDSINPEEVLIDGGRKDIFSDDSFEGRIVKPISSRTVVFLGAIFLSFFIIYLGRLWYLQVANGESYRERSENNSLAHKILFAKRGVIADRDGVPLAWNEPIEGEDFFQREYYSHPSFGHIIGYITHPQKDSSGFFYQEDYQPKSGVEYYFNKELSGENGKQLVEVNARGEATEGGQLYAPIDGEVVNLSIDIEMQEKMYELLEDLVAQVGFNSGVGLLMDADTGELLVATNYPGYDTSRFAHGDGEYIESLQNDPRKPFLNRYSQGLFTPGSIVKPFMSMAGLQEGIVNENSQFESTGKLVVPNPYNPDAPSIFTDWKAHGWVDVRDALAVSSNIYFYHLGGGFGGRDGLGIWKISEYMKKFGFGVELGEEYFKGPEGVIPDPDWKQEIFEDDWRLGDTYFTSIGQYGFQITPLQALRATSAVATGELIEPTLEKDSKVQKEDIDFINSKYQRIVQEGMRQAVLDGTAKGLSREHVSVAAKTGTAELGASKANVNSWVIGYFPYEDPKYIFTVMMERGDRNNYLGGVYIMSQFIDWMLLNREEDFR